MSSRCRWHTEQGIRFLVPGCLNRAVHGDDAVCHCPSAEKPAAEDLEDRAEALEAISKDAKLAEIESCPACGALPCDWSGGANPHAYCEELTEGGWQPIKTAPKDGTGIIVIDMAAKEPSAGAGYWADDVWSCVDPAPGEGIDRATIQAITWGAPTHWQPLPAPPQDTPNESTPHHG